LEGGRVELSQGVPQLVEVPLARPDQALVCPSQDLHAFRQLRIAGHFPVQVTVGSDQIRQHLGVPGIRLGPRGPMPVAVAVN
jgi:hypothetical protein